jgi:SAM-dependent methyltransferase|tara:strand:- start:26859 stop:27317 length:459 start_codon:yes stop_codon:yes gene_type:complete
MSPDLDIDLMDSDGKYWPYKDSSFNIVYSKSFIEHLNDSVTYMSEAYRVLKPGGVIINLIPDWASNHKIFYDDYTHKTPFTVVSLQNISTAAGFINVKAFTFRQLPFTWKYWFLNTLCGMIAPLIPSKTEIKILRWSRELMLLGYGVKPDNK